MIHLALLGVLMLALLIWAVKYRVWELEVTIEMPDKPADPKPEEKANPE